MNNNLLYLFSMYEPDSDSIVVYANDSDPFILDFGNYILCLIKFCIAIFCIIILDILCILYRFETFCKHFATTFNFYAYHIASNIS